VSSGVLLEDQVYLVEIMDDTAGTQHIDITRATSYTPPESLVPSDGQPHAIRWRVTVAAPNAEGAYRFVGAQGEYRRFTLHSR
jgi:hypothetical protein